MWALCGAPYLKAMVKATVHLELGLACLCACYKWSYWCHLCSCSFSMLFLYHWKMESISPCPLPNNMFIKWVFCTEGGEGLTEKVFKVRRRAKPSCSWGNWTVEKWGKRLSSPAPPQCGLSQKKWKIFFRVLPNMTSACHNIYKNPLAISSCTAFGSGSCLCKTGS